MEHDPYRVCGIQLYSVAAAGKQTANPPEALCHRNRRHRDIKNFPKVPFRTFAVNPRSQDTPDNAAVYDKAVLNAAAKKRRICKNVRQSRQKIQNLRAQKTAQHRPDRQWEHFFPVHLFLFCTVFHHIISRQNSDRNHQSIAVYGKRSNRKQVIFHTL